MADFTPLKAPKLDPRNERDIAELAIQRTYNLSGKTLNDFSPSSPTRVLIEALAFCHAELLYYVNKLPLAVAIQFLQIAGVQRRIGAKAVVTLKFTLETTLSEPYIIPKGFTVSTQNRKHRYRTEDSLVIPAGDLTRYVVARSTKNGEGANVRADTITKIPQSLPFLAGVTNPDRATGGLGAETLEQVKARGFRSLRRRGLITREDYHHEARRLLGEGATVKVLPNVGGDGRTRLLGAVHLFVLNPDGQSPNQAQLDELRTSLRNQSQVGISVFVSSAERHLIGVRLVAELVPGDSPQDTANRIWTRFASYLRPGSLPTGEPILIDNLRYQARLARLSFVEYLEIYERTESGLNKKGYTNNYILPSRWSVPILDRLELTLSDGDNEFRYAMEPNQ
jgi:hypothetical protein